MISEPATSEVQAIIDQHQSHYLFIQWHNWNKGKMQLKSKAIINNATASIMYVMIGSEDGRYIIYCHLIIFQKIMKY